VAKSGSDVGFRQIRGKFDDRTIIVYQAYSAEIAGLAIRAGRLVPPFKRERMTWIKPSFLWMMYRCGWASKPGQEQVLAIQITREGFEWALEHSALSHYHPALHTSHAAWEGSLVHPVRIQWDPERDLQLNPLPHRSIQIGLSGEAVARYVDEWIVSIIDVTDTARAVWKLVGRGQLSEAKAALPQESIYPLRPELRAAIGATG
jgi:hypothetical protein